MNPKMKSAIEKITLNDATFSNEVIEPTYVNFFYGKNGAGKSTIARTFKANDERLQWQAGKASTDYDVLVYDTDFINANLRNYGNLAGVFTVNETNIAIQEQVDTLNAERKKMGEEYNGHKAAIDQKTADKNTALSTFQSDCWSKSAEARTLFDEAIKGKKKAALFAQEILAITPVAHDVEDLKTLYGTVFSGDAQQYNMLSKAGKVTYASLPGYELMGKPISSSSDTDFAKFIKALKATDWVRSGHTHFAGQTDGKCPYCQQKLPSNFDKEIAACFDAQYQDDISAINAFQRTYESEMDSVVATLEGNVSAAMPELDLSEYEVKVQLLVDAITINKQRIAAKIKEPTSIASLEDTDSLLIEIGTLIDGFNKKIKENNEIVRDLKTKKVLCKKQVWEYLAELLKADVAAYNKALSDLDTEIKALKDKMEQLKKDATAKKKEANELNKQIVNTEATIDSINVLLDNSGFEGFHLRAKDGVANTYEVIRPDGTVAEKLSEGERNFIAFLYYYHLVKGSLNSEAVKDKIVVIDDPVSSMDSGALFIVSALVREMIEVCYNNTDYRSHKVDGDYIKQIFILTHNVYFHKEITHHQAKRYHSVSFYMIRKIENISSVSPVYYMLRPWNAKEDVRYYNYIFQTTMFQRSLFGLGNGILIKESGNGKLNTIRMRIPMDKFGGLFIPVAPTGEQHRIADFLDAKCAEIDVLTTDIQTQIDTLEQYKRSVITETVTKGLNPDAEMKDSGIQWIGNMPSHWEVIRGKYILRYMQKPVRDDDGVITCFRDGEVTLRNCNVGRIFCTVYFNDKG